MSTEITEIVVVDGDDGIGLYVNGKLDLQGHGRSRHADIIAWAGQHAPLTVRLLFADIDWLHERGVFPEDLSEVKVSSEDQPRPELAAQ